MAAYTAKLRSDIDYLITGAWVEFSSDAKWIWKSEFRRMDWLLMERNGDITYPFVVADVSEGQRWGPMTAMWWQSQVRLIYVLQANTASFESQLDDRMDVMEAWLGDQVSRENFQAIRRVALGGRDIGLSSEENEDLTSLKLPATSACFSFSCVWPGFNAVSI